MRSLFMDREGSALTARSTDRMNRSLLANFVELVDVLMKNPALFK
jgi:hypothetical protein